MHQPTLRIYFVNALTIVRMIGVLVVIDLRLRGAWWGIVLCLFAAFATDWLDGWLARRWRVVSAFGAFFDPLADKLICLTVLWLALPYYNNWLYWACVVIISAYDLSTMGLRLVAQRMGSAVVTSRLAKLKTGLLMGSLLLLTAAVAARHNTGEWVHPVRSFGTGFLVIAAGLSVYSLRQYLKQQQAPSDSDRSDVCLTGATSIAELDSKNWCQQRGITCLLLDIEGTLAPWGSDTVTPDMVKTLRQFRRSGIRHIGLITNIKRQRRAKVRQLARQLEADAYYLPETFWQRKPNPAMMRQAMQKFGVQPREVAVVGDKLADVLAARRAGVKHVVWVDRYGETDQFLDRLLYRPLEPLFKRLLMGANKPSSVT